MKRQVFCLALLATSLFAAHQPAAACPVAADIEPQMLAGRWRIEWIDSGRPRGDESWTLALGPHPEYEGSLKGQLSRGHERHAVVADWDDQTLTMEESVDGRRIAATWQATASEGQCARVFQGLRFTGSEADASARRFRMVRELIP